MRRRELYYFSLYRVLEAALLALLFFSPANPFLGVPLHPSQGQAVTVAYLVLSIALLLWARRHQALRWQVMLGTGLDIAAATLATHAAPFAAPGIALMLVFNIGAAAMLLPLRYGLGAALIAAAALMAEFVWSAMFESADARPLAERVMFAVSYCAIAMLTYLLGRQMRDTHALAERRGAEAADLAAINELIIRRMRTGVLLVDGNGVVRMANEAALMLLGEADGVERSLALAAPSLARRLDDWRTDGKSDDAPLLLGVDQSEVMPRFARLLATSQSTLVFLDDASQVSRRAESMTLAAMGRFSASLAHEIRNPLAAISYATQLLEESRDISTADHRLLQIIHQQCMRTNGIVESVLALARRERANPEHVELNHFVQHFVDDYSLMLSDESGQLVPRTGSAPVAAMVDPRHLQQVLTVLVQNAVTYGRMPGERARVSVRVQHRDGVPTIEVVDRGPGVAEGAMGQLFRPFFTTSEHGTGLGLYIARELCRANEARLDYVPIAAGGGCFRIGLAAPQALIRG